MRRRAKQQLHNLLGLVNGGAGGLGLLGFLWSASGVMAAVRTALNIASVAVESLRIANFTPEQVVELYAQHTAETGQPFTPEATDRAFEYSQGQPWLVNALAREVTQAMRVSPPDLAATPLPHLRKAVIRENVKQQAVLNALNFAGPY